jgi:hypothetical protein
MTAFRTHIRRVDQRVIELGAIGQQHTGISVSVLVLAECLEHAAFHLGHLLT